MTNDEGPGPPHSSSVSPHSPYEALLIVAFGGPEGPDEVVPFLENVTRGRPVPRQRLLEVAEHYYQLGGRSPINSQIRSLAAAVAEELNALEPPMRVYWGNRNWHPYLADTLRQMAVDGVRRALAFFTSPFSSYSSCRQYLENIAAAQAEVGPSAPQIDKLRAYFNHPKFIEAVVDRTLAALQKPDARIIFTAHSIPLEMARHCRYEEQLRESSRLVFDRVTRSLDPRQGGAPAQWDLVYQSRSGPPQQPWLEPDINDFIRAEHAKQPIRDLVVVPIGFISDHMEVLYDLDTETKQLCDELGIDMVRAETVGTHPRFVRMIRELIVERTTPGADRPALGPLGPSHDMCPADCCTYAPQRPTS